jgi:hypothetical protein
VVRKTLSLSTQELKNAKIRPVCGMIKKVKHFVKEVQRFTKKAEAATSICHSLAKEERWIANELGVANWESSDKPKREAQQEDVMVKDGGEWDEL